MKTNDPKKMAKKARRLTVIDLVIILGVVVGLLMFYRLSVNRTLEIQEQVKQEKTQQNLGRVIFFDDQNKRNIEIIVEIAENEYQKENGLMFRENLPENQGMLFTYEDELDRYFWMKNTSVSLDIIFINSAYKIIKIHKNTVPFAEELYPSEGPAQFVVEVRAGFSERYLIKEGQRISWEYL